MLPTSIKTVFKYAMLFYNSISNSVRNHNQVIKCNWGLLTNLTWFEAIMVFRHAGKINIRLHCLLTTLTFKFQLNLLQTIALHALWCQAC